MDELVKELFMSTLNELSDSEKEAFAESTWNSLAVQKDFSHTWEQAQELLLKSEEETVLPYEVGEFLKKKKALGYSLGETFNCLFRKKFTRSRQCIPIWIREHSESFAKAWITEKYEIEPVPVFYWKKKTEYLASFEKCIYLGQYSTNSEATLAAWKFKTYSKEEAEKLLGEDFHMFEPVSEEIDDQEAPTQEVPHAF